MVVSLVAIRKGENWLLENEARESAVKWATYLRGNLSGLDRLLSGDPISKGDRRIFELASKAGNIFRYKVFGPTAIIVFASRASDLGKTNTNPYFSRLVKEGRTFVKIEREENFGKNRTVVSEAYVPIMKRDRFKGAIEVYVDMTARAMALRRTSNIFLAGLLLLLGGIGGVCGMFVRYNIRTRNLELRQLVDSRESILVAEQKLSAIFHTSPSFIAITGIEDGLFYDINDTWLAVTGYMRDEIVGHTTKELKIWAIPEHRKQIVALMKKQGYVRNFETEFGVKDGRIMPVMISIAWIEIDGEQRLLTVATDITERRRAEAALKESEETLNAFFSNAPVGMALYDSDIRYLKINKELVWDANLSVDEHIGKALAEIKPEVAKIVEPVYRSVFESGDPMVLPESRLENPAAPGVEFWSTGFAFPTSWTNGKPSKVGVVVVDITERKQMENELRELNTELEQRVEDRTAELRAAQGELVSKERLATLGQISATVSHELRNPLGTILNSLVVLENKLGGKNLGVQQSLDRMARNIERCNKIIDDMLDFARARGVELNVTAFDAWLDDVLKELGAPSGVTIRRMLGASKARPRIDDGRLRRAVVNVYDNACQSMIEASKSKGPARKKMLTVSTKASNGRLELTITDTGPGMPPEVVVTAFEPLFSTKGFGVGLGLPIVKHIMEQHGGGVEIKSRQGRGTQVVLWLPLRRAKRKMTAQ
ncbi:MAG: PAS domain S-box protein [Alphaproteobacteria bacterium]|nr:PAS domain S-box protein [Alphaproteobacteria bacterium]